VGLRFGVDAMEASAPGSGLGRFGGEWAAGPVLDAMEASGLQVRSWTPWRRVGCRSGLGRHGGEWVAGPVLDAMEASGL
jgi:hypothetical protein